MANTSTNSTVKIDALIHETKVLLTDLMPKIPGKLML
jgi:hypothetical protein